MTRDKAWEIVKKYVKNGNLRRHMLAVEAVMAKYWEYFAREERKGKKDLCALTKGLCAFDLPESVERLNRFALAHFDALYRADFLHCAVDFS